MAVALASTLKLKSLIPAFRLPQAWGGEIELWDYKGLKNLVLAFFPGGPCAQCDGFVDAVKGHIEHYRDDNAVVLLVLRGDEQDAADLMRRHTPPFPVLYDGSGKVTAQYTSYLPAVFVADKFQELYAEWIVGPDGRFPSQKELLDVLDLINLECPE